jgi:hypothetical protein
MSDERLRTQLEVMLDEELRTLASEEKVSDIKELRPWMNRIKELDNCRQIHIKRMAKYFDEATSRAAKRQNNGHSSQYQGYNANNRNNNNNVTRPNASASSSANPLKRPPKLTPDECQLLFDHKGCLKCRKFNAGHLAKDCTAPDLTGKDYKTLTLQDALRSNASKANHTAPVASITEAFSAPLPNDLIAAVFPQGTDAGFSDSSDNSLASVSPTPPLKGKHFIWTCSLSTVPDNVRVNTSALIDSGAHMALIRPDLVARLQLQTHTLDTPENVNVAIGSHGDVNQLTHYVIIEPSSTDKLFRSQRIRAVLALGLCMPLILGLPFLSLNKVVCNYAKRTCLATCVLPPYDLMASPKLGNVTQTLPPDTLAAISERMKTLSLEEEYAAREAELRTRFARVFEPPPHVNELPKEPLARIKLKDPDVIIKSRNYPCPRKWKEVWHQLLQQHLDAGRIRPSSAPTGSGAFIIPKADPSVPPRWVNDYR